MRLRRFVAACLFALVAAPAFAQQPAPAGRIKVSTGEAFIVRSGKPIAARVGDSVLASDVLRTGADGTLGVTLRDDTRVSLAPASEVRLDSFLYNPSGGQLGLVLKFVLACKLLCPLVALVRSPWPAITHLCLILSFLPPRTLPTSARSSLSSFLLPNPRCLANIRIRRLRPMA
jgi:hypothetical protein